MTNEIKDNSITVEGSVLNSTEKTVNKGQVIELKVRIPADQFDGCLLYTSPSPRDTR